MDNTGKHKPRRMDTYEVRKNFALHCAKCKQLISCEGYLEEHGCLIPHPLRGILITEDAIIHNPPCQPCGGVMRIIDPNGLIRSVDLTAGRMRQEYLQYASEANRLEYLRNKLAKS